MSGINGDKSRFNRERKQKIARRARNRARFKNQGALKTATPNTPAPAKSVAR